MLRYGTLRCVILRYVTLCYVRLERVEKQCFTKWSTKWPT